MDLPVSVTALGEQLRGTADIIPDPALFQDADVFAAEREQIFVRPLIAVDHETRLSEDGHYFRCDAAHRSLIVTRESGGCLHALRNVCIHAGYPVCDVEEGPAQRLICPYHGWEYTLDGKLVEPALSSRIDPSRLRLTEYPLFVRNGLILVDLSGKSAAAEQHASSVPAWIATAKVAGRARYKTGWNWKFLRYFLQSSPQLFVDDEPDGCLEFGPLSWMTLRSDRAVLLRVFPRFAEQTDFELIEIVAEEGLVSATSSAGSDVIAEGLRRADTDLNWFDRDFADWYWSTLSVA
jgi:nitrite reductase/ring-hydroxylating ferredoxin subunit